ncbi:hypothetical protein BDM02DRAFT_3122702 [Thelephora ganbajun]|uniref:Uncharacterized protein n=1 Tax=Thelephora ganbajun TaxID=370292 RepID=A0ACB6Z3K0_THEGA|nr:hypothetical protein BDM02DRAFT_3122702 [Thelephora ganbajun]
MLASVSRVVRRRQPGSAQQWLSTSPVRKQLHSSSAGEAAVQEGAKSQPESETGRNAREDPSYEQWLATIGRQYKRTDRRNWLGGSVPFPLNPSFKPPTPLSDARRQHIFDQFILDPKVNNARALASRHGISIKRVDAILRLKGLEASWKKGKGLQTGFSAGMESLLGVHDTPSLSAAQELGVDAVEADLQDQDDLRGQLRDRYVRNFWEPVVEGVDPVVPGVLEHARQTAAKHVQAAEDAKSDPKILGRDNDNPPKVQLLPSGNTPGRPMIEFVDVGGKFINVKEHTIRARERARRRAVKDKKKVQIS